MLKNEDSTKNVSNNFEIDIFNDIKKKKEFLNNDNQSEEIIFKTILETNNNLRFNIKLSLAIYKKLNNFDHNYIHHFINEKSKNSK